MIDAATLSLWATDLVLLALAYWIGRVHAAIVLRDVYTKTLDSMLAEVKALRFKIDRMSDLNAVAREAIKSDKP